MPYVELLGLGMFDELERIGHRSLDDLERTGKGVLVVFKAPLKGRIIVDPGEFAQRALGRRGIFSGELLPFVERA